MIKKPIQVCFVYEHKKYVGTGERHRVYPTVQIDLKWVDKMELEQNPVSLSRDGTKCYFTLDRFSKHQPHAPKFNDVREIQAYVTRIAEDIKKVAKRVCRQQAIVEMMKKFETTSPSLYQFCDICGRTYGAHFGSLCPATKGEGLIK